MPYRTMNILEVARLLGLDVQKAERLAQQGQIPCQKVAGQYRFNRAAVTEWLQNNMAQLGRADLAQMDAGITATRQRQPDEAIIAPLLQEEIIDLNLKARTKNSVLKELTALAVKSGLVYEEKPLYQALEEREGLCSTAMEGGIAIPHPRRPMPYAIARPILVVAHTGRGIGFGGPDGRLTDLFFMTCSQDDRHHLHVLARLCRMLHNSDLADKLRECSLSQEVIQLMQKRESEVIAQSG